MPDGAVHVSATDGCRRNALPDAGLLPGVISPRDLIIQWALDHGLDPAEVLARTGHSPPNAGMPPPPVG